jgi:hypothetical protein
MLKPSIVEEIRFLLAEKKWNYGQIARAAGVCRATVGRIARGEGPYAHAPEPPGEAEPTGPAERCKACGGLVYMPCRVCRLRRRMALRRPARRPRPEAGEGGLLGLDLKPEHRARYQEVRAWRQRAGRELPGDQPPWGTRRPE